jgi:hypothetical protein
MRGGQWQVLYLLRGLRERGHELKLLARGQLLEQARVEGFDAKALRWRLTGWGDVVHAHDARAHSLAAVWPIGGIGRRALVVSRRVAFPVRTGFFSRWKYRRPDHYIAVSNGVAEKLVEAGIKSLSISVVYDGVPVVKLCQPPVGGLVVAAATADPMKGSDLLRQAAQLAGVEIAFSDNLSRDIGRASVFVYISRSEGLGSAALLAMAHGVPVVASRIGGLTEVVADGESGILVENTAVSIASAVRTLVDDDCRRERMGRAGRAIVEQRFSLASMVEGTVRVYEKVRA